MPSFTIRQRKPSKKCGVFYEMQGILRSAGSSVKCKTLQAVARKCNQKIMQGVQLRAA